jgi:hypothetical protein
MSETKALDKILEKHRDGCGLVQAVEWNVPCSCWRDEAIVELSELAKRNEYLESVVIGIVKSTGANTATEALMRFSKLRTELDEARKMLDMLGLLEVTK